MNFGEVPVIGYRESVKVLRNRSDVILFRCFRSAMPGRAGLEAGAPSVRYRPYSLWFGRRQGFGESEFDLTRVTLAGQRMSGPHSGPRTFASCVPVIERPATVTDTSAARSDWVRVKFFIHVKFRPPARLTRD